MLNLNSTKIDIKKLNVQASLELASTDTSGQSSLTEQAETGAKAKQLYISGYIPFKEAEKLSQLFNMAEATDNGARVIYRISNHTADGLGIKQVRFDESIEAREQENTRQWRVSFKLVEYRSVPEKKEQRLPETAANQQGGNDEPDLTGFQTVLRQSESELA